jgi:Rad3-related DNA helicase
MGFRIKKKENLNFSNPKEMYKDYKSRTIDGLLDYQTDMINTYMKEAYDKSDVALELPTGSGKTLIGLVIGEYRRRKNREKIVYLCPNNLLVHQVANQASKKYGIRVNAFTGKFKEYDTKAKASYTRADSIAITNYSSLFNNSTFFNDADILIFDDAHSAEDYIASHWCLDISRFDNEILYKILVENLKDCIDSVQYNKMINDDPIDDEKSWIDKVPNVKLFNNLSCAKILGR